MKKLTAVILGILSQLGLRATEPPVSIFPNIQDDWGDVVLNAKSQERANDGSIVVDAISEDSGTTYGFRFVVLPDWGMFKPDDWPIDSYKGKIRIESLGDPSKRLIKAMSKAYKKEIEDIDFTSVELTAISLGGDPRNLLNEEVKLKLFFESENEDHYAEAYLNFLLDRSIVQFNEKDEDYRVPVLGFLTRGKDANKAVLTTSEAAPPTS